MTAKPNLILHRPSRILISILSLVFAAEVAVMFALPYLIPRSIGEGGKALLDAVLLTIICAPALWWMIIRPLRRIAIESHERSETVVANACDGILTVNRDGIIVSCNRAGGELLSRPGTGLIGYPIRLFLPAWPQHFAELPIQLELEAISGDRRSFPVQVSVSEYLKSAEGKLIVILRDLSSAKRAEQERLTLVREAEALRAQQMTTLAQLATGVAHEIRNPLTSIKMLIQVNRVGFAEAGLPTDDLQLVEQEIRRMERSVNDLLDYARPERSELKELTFQESVQRTIQLIQGQLESQNVELTLEMPTEPMQIIGDAAQIHQLLLNLCLNAMDAMKSGGELRVTLRPRVEEVELSVRDTGPGICSGLEDRIFDPFVTTKSNGIGLGLGICRRIAESHRGTLHASNLDSGGAEFRLSLPMAPDGFRPSTASSNHESLCQSC